MNCDPIARAYRYLEYGSFGSALQRRRCHFLRQLGDARRVLMLGEGDGRFLAEFVRRNPQAEVDYIDGSAKMLALARRRAGSARVRFHRRDLLDAAPPQGPFDTITTHFFLDCLSDNDVTRVVKQIAATANPGARWIVSEFREPEAGWRRLRAKLWISGLYTAFRMVTQLSTGKLPDHARALQEAGFVMQEEALASAGLLTSQLWIR